MSETRKRAEKRITLGELAEIFGDELPMRAFVFLFHDPVAEGMSLAEVRAKLRKIASIAQVVPQHRFLILPGAGGVSGVPEPRADQFPAVVFVVDVEQLRHCLCPAAPGASDDQHFFILVALSP